jgi:Holliday junction resolvase RusA-like endonuclease
MAYTPKKTATYEQFIKLVACDYIRAPFLGPLVLNIRVYRSIPKSFSRKLNTMAEAGEIRPTTRPDCDNFLKSALDGMNGVAFRDDSQIVSVAVHKFYSSEPRTEIEIEEIRQGDQK